MTRRRSSPLGLELVASVVLALVALPLLSHGAPVQDAHADLQKYSEGCYYNYNHYSEGDRILTNEPCLNCTCHNRMLMCYLRVCPFTKPIGHDCTVEKREDQCCPIITCPEVPVDVSHHNHQLTTHAPGTELSIPEKYGCSIDSKFYPEGAQVPSNPHKPCELCYCIRNRTSCLMQECTLHIDGCQPIYNKGSCCPVRYSCDHENELLELEDFSTTTTTVRPTPGYILTSTTSPSISTDCLHNGEVYADGASITGKNACEHCYCMRGDIVCAVQECEMPTLESGAKTCRALPPNPGECCPSNYVCDDSSTETPLIEEVLTTLSPKVQSDLHGSVSQEDVQLQEHIDDKIAASDNLDKTEEHPNSDEDVTPVETTIATFVSEGAESDVKGDKQTPEFDIEESPLATTMSTIKETSITPTQSPIELSTPHKTETEIDDTHIITDQDKKDDSLEHDIVTEHQEIDIVKDVTTDATSVEDTPIPSKDETTSSSELSEEEKEEKDVTTIRSPIESIKLEEPSAEINPVLVGSEAPVNALIEKTEQEIEKEQQSTSTESPVASDITPDVPSLGDILSSTDLSAISAEEEEESSSEIAKPSEEEQSLGQTSIHDKIDEDIVGPSISSTTASPVYEMVTQGEDSDVEMPEIADHKTGSIDDVNKPKDEAPAFEVPTTDGVKKEELPEFVTDGTTITSIIKEEAEEITSKPSSIAPETPDADSTESEESSSEAEDLGSSATIKPSIPTEDAQSEENTEDVQKPVKSEDEIPAIVQDSTYQSTELPTEISDEVTIPQDFQDKQTSVEESDEQSTEPITDVQKEDSVPVFAEKDESAISPANDLAEDENVKDKPQQVVPDSTTIASISDDGAPTAEKEEDKIKGQSEKDLEDSTTLSPSGSESQAPITDDEEIKKQQEENITDATTIATSVAGSEIPTTEEEQGLKQESAEEDKGQPEQGIAESEEPSSGENIKTQPNQEFIDSTTIAPSVIDSDDQEVTDPSTVVPASSDSVRPSADEEIKGRPEDGVKESSTITSPVVEYEETVEGESKPQPDMTDSEATIPSIIDSKEPSVEDEDLKQKPEQDITGSATAVPSIIDSKEPSVEDEDLKQKPEQDITGSATAVPSIALTEETAEEVVDSSTVSGSEGQSAEEEIKGRPEDGVKESSTSTSPVVEYEETVEGESKPQPDMTDSAATIPSIIDSKEPIAEDEDLKQKPEQDITVSATTVPSVALSEEIAEDVQTKEKPEPGSAIAPSLGDSEIPTITEEDLKQKPEKHIVDSTAATLADIISGETAEDDQVKEKPEEEATVVPSLSDSETPSAEDEGTKTQPEQNTTDSTTPPISVAESEDTAEEEQVKEKPEQELTDTTTILPSVSLSETQHAIEEEIKEQEVSDTFDSITATPSATESELTLEEEEEVKDKPEQDIDSATIPLPISDFEAPSPEEEKIKPVQDETPATDSDKESELEDIHRITLPPTADENESEVVHGAEGSGDQMQEIIPPAIPGEGDCLYNNKTYAHNAEVPATSECETACSCASSVVVCQRVLCYEPPQPDNCVLDETSTDRCCPQYICGDDSFVNGQRPTPSEDIEEEEIEYTTLQPVTNAPAIIGLATGKPVQHEVVLDITTRKPDEEPTEETQKQESNEATIAPQPPIDEDELTKTEQAILSEISTPSSVDIELVAITPEQPMSHVKDDEVQEPPSAEGSGEGDISTERPQVSDESVQPLPTVTPKPVQQISGDIEEPVQVDSDLNAPPKKASTAEENTTPTATDDEYKESATVPPSVPGVSTTDESATIATHTETIKPILTETPNIIGSSKIDENIFDAVSESTTIKPVEVEMPSVAPSLSSVLDLEGIDSTESAELPETDGQSPNESGEEMIGSEEDTKLPVAPEEEIQKTTTAAPFAGEQSTIKTVHTELEGEIEPSESATIIPERDYQKPEMPEDLSHTKVEEETPATKKPSTSGVPQEGEESDESTERIPEILGPSEVSVSTILKPVEPTDQHEHDTESRPEIFDKKDEFPATDDITPSHQKPLDQSSGQAPIDEEKPLSSTITPDTSEGLAAGTVAPVSVDKSEVEKEEQAIAGTIAPISEDSIQSSSPITDEQLIAETEASTSIEESEENKDETASQTSAPAIEDSGEESNEDKGEIANQTSTPTFAEKPTAGAVSPISEEESDEDKEITSQTNVPTAEEIATAKPVYPISGEEPNEDEAIPDQINGLSVDEKPIEGTVSPTSGEESNEDSQTSKPSVEEKPTVGSLVPISEEESDEDNEITSQTSMPTAEENPTVEPVVAISGEESDEDTGISSQTSVPIVDSKPVAASEEGSDENQEIMIQTSVPTLVGKPTAGPVIPISSVESDGDEETVTNQPISGTIGPISGDVSQTSAPIVDEQPISDTTTPISTGPLGEEKDETSSQTSAPITGTVAAGSTDISEEDKGNDFTDQTGAPVAEEHITETTTPVTANTSQEEKDEITSQTDIATDKEQPFAGTTASTTANESEDKKDGIASQSNIPSTDKEPTAQDETNKQEEQEILSGIATSTEALEKDIEEPQTAAPVTVDKSDTSENMHGVEEDLLSQTPITISPSEESIASSSTTAPAKQDEEIISETAKPITSDEYPGQDKEKEPSVQIPLGEKSEEQDLAVAKPPSVLIPVTEIEGEDVLPTGKPDEPTPVEVQGDTILEAIDSTSITSVETIAPTEAPVKSEEEADSNATETPLSSLTEVPVKSQSEEEADSNATETPLSIPTKTVEAEDTVEEESESDKIPPGVDFATEIDLSSTQSPAVEKYDQALPDQISTAVPTSADTSASPVSPAISESDKEKEDSGDIPESTPVDVDAIPSKADRGSEEEPDSDISTEVPVSATQKPVSGDEENIDKTLLQTGVPETADEAIHPVDQDHVISGEIAGSPSELPGASTDSSVSFATQEPIIGDKDNIDNILLQTEVPETANESIHAVDQDHVISGEIAGTSSELPSAATDSSVSSEVDSSTEAKKPIIDDVPVPEVIVIDEVTAQPSKPDSDAQVAVDEISSETVKPAVDDEIAAATESPTGSLLEKEKPTSIDQSKDDEIESYTKKPVSTEEELEQEDVQVPLENQATTEQTVTKTETPIPVTSVAQKEDEVLVSTGQPSKPEHIANEVLTQTEQPIAHDEETVKDTTDKPSEEASISQSEEDDKEAVSTIAPVNLSPSTTKAPDASVDSESTTTSSEELEEENEQTVPPKDDVKIQTVAEFVTERVDDVTTALPAIDTNKDEVSKPSVPTLAEVMPTSSEEEDKEDEVPEVPVTTEKATISTVAESDVKEPEMPPKLSEIDLKSEERPALGAIPSSTSEKPIVSVEDKLDAELSKPIATDEATADQEQEETPVNTTYHPLFSNIELDRTTFAPSPNASDKIDDKIHISESTDKPTYTSSSTIAPITEEITTQKSVTSAPTSHYQPPGYGPVPPQYPSYTEDEYTDEDETEVFGPGTCRYGGKLFVSAQQIPRDDPCDFCFCFRSDIICLQQSCPPPISGCHEEPISGFCCPRYECPVSMATVLNITTSTTTTSTTLPPHFLHHAYRGAAEKNGCHINGKSYRVGDKIESASGPCMHCTCGGDGQMKCDPKTCSPEPMLRQMIAVVASRRR